MTHERNTPEAPALDWCRSCGATRLHGRGDVCERTFTMPNGEKTDPLILCNDCREGSEALVTEDPDEWEFGKDGHLIHKKVDPLVETRKAAVDRLHAALRAVPDVELDKFHPQSGVAVILPNKYRWHVFTREANTWGADAPTAVLLAPSLEYVMRDGAPIVVAFEATTEDGVAETVKSLVLASQAEGTIVEDAITQHVLNEMQIRMFDPDQFLRGEDA